MKTLITNKFFRVLAILLLTVSGGASAKGECTYNAQGQVTTDTDVADGYIKHYRHGYTV